MKWMRKCREKAGKRWILPVMGIMLIATVYFGIKETTAFVVSRRVEEKELCVVIDAGHGGDDPGKIGINGALEKDINLQVAKKVQMFLEAEGIKTVMTRTDENGLYNKPDGNKKVQDMKRRIQVIDKACPHLTVSIHQNSYPEEYVKGAQVFYYENSKEGKEAAEIMQKSLRDRLDEENKRQAKGNTSYYLLKKTSSPIIIVECGFLSNAQEAQKLCDDQYQEKVAWAVFMGIMQTLKK